LEAVSEEKIARLKKEIPEFEDAIKALENDKAKAWEIDVGEYEILNINF
jgi:hypothetical protein